jgi:large subunit ribosomal protein L28
MSFQCSYCGKGSIKGNHVLRSGKPKKEGGVGLHTTAITKRRFYPNLQRVKAVVNGTVHYRLVCASCMKAGRVVRPPLRNYKPEAKAAA